MKTIKYFSTLIMLIFISVSIVSCGKDEENNDPSISTADAVAGVYTGQLSYNGEIVEDAYVVTVTKISSSVVHLNANFYGNSGGENFNVVYSNGQYIISSATAYNITITITGKIMTLSYLTQGGLLYDFRGSKD